MRRTAPKIVNNKKNKNKNNININFNKNKNKNYKNRYFDRVTASVTKQLSM